MGLRHYRVDSWRKDNTLNSVFQETTNLYKATEHSLLYKSHNFTLQNTCTTLTLVLYILPIPYVLVIFLWFSILMLWTTSLFTFWTIFWHLISWHNGIFAKVMVTQCWMTYVWWTERDQRWSNQPLYSHMPGGLGESIWCVSVKFVVSELGDEPRPPISNTN